MSDPSSDAPQASSAPTCDDEIERLVHDRRTLRLGLGVTIVFLIALLYDWPLAYLAPAFASPLLQTPSGPSLRGTIRTFLATVAVSLACLFAARVSHLFPVLFLVAIFPVMFWTFRFGLRGGSPLIMWTALVGLMLVPMVADTTVEVTRKVAWSLVQDIGISLVIALVMYALLPPLPAEASSAKQEPALPEPEVTRRSAILTVITGFYAVAYFSFGWTNVHTPIYIAIYAFSLDLSRGTRAIKGILAANIVGGILAIVLYQLTRMTPYLPFVMVMVLTVNLILARFITAKVSWAPLAGFVLSVVMILYGESILPFGDSGGSNFTDRFGELAMAAIWAVGALYVLTAYFPQKPVADSPLTN